MCTSAIVVHPNPISAKISPSWVCDAYATDVFASAHVRCTRVPRNAVPSPITTSTTVATIDDRINGSALSSRSSDPARNTRSDPSVNRCSSRKNRKKPGSRCRYLTENAPTIPASTTVSSANGTDKRSASSSTTTPGTVTSTLKSPWYPFITPTSPVTLCGSFVPHP